MLQQIFSVVCNVCNASCMYCLLHGCGGAGLTMSAELS